MHHCVLTILGSASGMPNPDRAGSGYLLDIDGSLSLIDCGGGVASSFFRQGYDPHQLDRIFITHTHADHVAELPVFIQLLHGIAYGRNLEVYVPEEFVRPFENYLPAVYLLRNRLKLELNVHGYTEGLLYDGDFRLEAIANTHVDKLAKYFEELDLPYRGQSFSFRIEAGEKSIFHSADVGSFDDVEPHLHDLDFALIETTHISPADILQHARKSSVRQYILTHLGDEEEVANLNEMIEQFGSTNVTLAHDGMRLVLS
jgi:ribonuclease BN (tRNA processing enzyme)